MRDGVIDTTEVSSLLDAAKGYRDGREQLIEAAVVHWDQLSDNARTKLVAGIKTGPVTAPNTSAESVTSVIAALSQRRDELEAEIAKLESENTQKSQEISNLIAAIEARKAEIQRDYHRQRDNALIFALFGIPAGVFASVIAAQNADSRLQQLNQDLAARKQEQASLNTKLDNYKAMKAELTARLEELKTVAAKLSETPAPKSVSPGLEKLVAPAEKWNRSRALVENLKAQIAILTTLRDSAANLGVDLDALIGKLTKDLAKAEQMARQTEKEYFEILKIMLSNDPNAAAEKWLDDKLAAKVKEIKKSLGLDIGAFVDSLVKQLVPAGGAAATLLRKQLMQAFQS